MNLRSPLGRVLGLGSAREGVGHWWAQRLSAVALVPLTLWLVLSLAALGHLDYESVLGFLRQPLHTVLALLLVLASAHHSYLGVGVVIEDYVHAPVAKITCLIVARFAHVLAAAVGVFALLRIAFGTHIP